MWGFIFYYVRNTVEGIEIVVAYWMYQNRAIHSDNLYKSNKYKGLQNFTNGNFFGQIQVV